MDPPVDLRQLRYFVAVAEELHFGRAAERLHMSQSPLSRAIRELERQLGLVLFVRTTRRVELTPAGAALLEHARRALAEVEIAIDDARHAAQPDRGVLGIGYGPFSRPVATRIAETLPPRPEVDVRLEEDVSPELLRRVATRELAVAAVLATPAAAERHGVRIDALRDEPLLAALPATHRYADAAAIPMDAFAAECVLLPREPTGRGFNAWLRAVFRAAGLELARTRETLSAPWDRRMLPVVEGEAVSAFVAEWAGAAQPGVVGVPFDPPQGVRTSCGNVGWRATTVANLLRNRVYLGEVRCGKYSCEGAHPPLTDPVTWQLAQTPAALPWPRRGLTPLTGLIRCASCWMLMGAMRQRHGTRQAHQYFCKRHSAAGPCPTPAHISSLVEACVEEIVFDLLRRRRREPRLKVDRAAEGLVLAQAALRRYRDSDRVLGTLGLDAYTEGLAVRIRRVEEATAALAALRVRAATHMLPPVAELEAAWPQMTVQTRRTVIAQVIDCVLVRPGPGSVESRITVCPAGTAPPLPRPGRKRSVRRQYSPRRTWVNGATAASLARRWDTARIDRELRGFLRGRTSWPHREEFHEAGHARLHRQIVIQGGADVWAWRVGLRPQDPAHHVPRIASAQRSRCISPTRKAGRRRLNFEQMGSPRSVMRSASAVALSDGQPRRAFRAPAATTARSATGPTTACALRSALSVTAAQHCPVKRSSGAPGARICYARSNAGTERNGGLTASDLGAGATSQPMRIPEQNSSRQRKVGPPTLVPEMCRALQAMCGVTSGPTSARPVAAHLVSLLR